MSLLEEYLTIPELAAEFGVSARTIFRYTKAGLPYLKLGGRPLVKRQDALDWLEARRHVTNASGGAKH